MHPPAIRRSTIQRPLRNPSAIRRAVQAAIESLEPRRLLAAIVVNGSNAADVISITSNGATLTVNNNGTLTNHVLADVSFITVNALAGADRVTLGDGVPPSSIRGGAGNDTLIGGSSNDSIFGDENDDLIDGGRGGDFMSGGSGIDTIDYHTRTAPVIVGLGVIADDGEVGEFDNARDDNEYILGGSGNDELKGTNGENALFGNGGNDTLIAQGGRDALWGGDGDDILDDGAGDDYVVGEAGHDGFRVGLGNDQIFGDGTNPNALGYVEYVDRISYAARTVPITVNVRASSAAALTATSGQAGETDQFDSNIDAIIGGSGNDVFEARAENFTASAGALAFTFDGRGGADQFNSFSSSLGASDPLHVTAFGDVGNDTFFREEGADLVAFGDADNDTYTTTGAAVTFFGGAGVDTVDQHDQSVPDSLVIDLRNTDVENAIGGLLGDTIYGNDLVNVLHGGGGDDQLFGLGGNDTLFGEANNDSLYGGDGDDLLYDGDGDDLVVGGNGNDGFKVGLGDDRLLGGLEGQIPTGEQGAGGDTIYFDTVNYADRANPITFTVSNVNGRTAVAGEAGEADQIDENIDALIGGQSGDTFDFQSSQPRYVFTTFKFVVDGRGGNDRVNHPFDDLFNSLVSVTAYGSDGNDQFYQGENGSLVAYGDAGDDVLFNEGGALSINGQPLFFGGTGTDTLDMGMYFGSSPRVIDLRGRDVENVYCGRTSAINLIIGNEFANRLVGGRLPDTIIGNGGNDTLVGSDDPNAFADNDIDLLIGGEGADEFIGGVGFDTADYSDRTDTIRASIGDGANDGAIGEGDDIRSDIEVIRGGSGADRLVGDALSNLLIGGGGADTLIGGEGRDILIGGAGADELQGTGWDDVLLGGDSTGLADSQSMQATFNTWSNFSLSYEQRTASLVTQPAFAPASLVDDLLRDTLSGNNGRDFFFQGENDAIDNVSGESVVQY